SEGLILLLAQFGDAAAARAGDLVVADVRREGRLADHAKVYDDGLQPSLADQVAHELVFRSFGIEGADDDNRFGHRLPPCGIDRAVKASSRAAAPVGVVHVYMIRDFWGRWLGG